MCSSDLGKPIAWDKTQHTYLSNDALGRTRCRLGEMLLKWEALTQAQLDAALDLDRRGLADTGVTDAGDEAQLTNTLREELRDFGVDVVRSSEVLASFARVQNTYLATFQTLGGLGLALGTFGLVTVLARNVLERRTELAMMLAVGFARGRLVRMVLLENVMLLGMGVAAGTLAALVGTLPQLVKAQTEVQWIGLLSTLLLTLAVGTVSCAVAARATMSGNLVEALRSE